MEEGIMEFLALVAVVFLIFWINSLIEKQRQKIRDRAAREILKDFNPLVEKQGLEKIRKEFLSRIMLSRCPQCKSVLRIEDNSKEIIWACSQYPKCDYVKGRVPSGIL